MKNSVLALVMLFMVLSFGINAFSAVSIEAVNGRLKQFIPAGAPALFAQGTTDSGKDCEVSVDASVANEVSVMVSARSMMGTKHTSFNLRRDRKLTSASENSSMLTINGVNSEGREILTIGTGNNGGQKTIRTIEITQEVSGFFGTRFKSLVNCILE